MKYLILFLFLLSFTSSTLAFRGGGGGGFRGGSVSVGVGVGGAGPRGNVSVGVGASGPRGSVAAYRSAPMGAYYHPYTSSYWGWYGYVPYYYYLPTTTYTETVEVDNSKAAEVGASVTNLPGQCEDKKINDINYKHCGVNWFEPQYYGTEIEYIVVRPP